MTMRQRQWLPWALAVPGLVMVGCSDPAPVPPRDTGAELAADVAADESTPDVAQDTGGDAKVRDSGTDASDDVVGKDAGDDATAPDAGDDATTPDAPAPDVGMDAPAPDAPAPDAPAPDAPAPDAPAPDAPAPDAPAPDAVADAGTCPFPTQRALTLPTDSVMATLAGMNRITTACVAVGGPDHIYPLRVAARTGVMLSTNSMLDTVLMVRRVCNSQMGELACVDDVPGGNNALIRRVLDPGDYYVVVDQFGMGGMGGAYTLNVASYTPAVNAECGMATTLTAATPLMGNTTAGGAAGTACLNNLWGPQLFYTVTVPAGQRATVTATPSGMPAWSAVVRAQTSCTAGACLASGSSAMAGGAAREVIDNRGTTPLTVTVSVASATPLAGGPFSVALNLAPVPAPPSNVTCRAATAVTSGMTLTEQNAALGTENATGACLPTATGTVLYYSVRVAAGEQLTANVTPAMGVDSVVRLLNACGATTCLANANANGVGGAETVTWTNATGADQTVFLAVGGNTNATNGSFNLSVNLRREYNLTTLPRACDDMTGATAMMGVGGDDTVSAITDLPFPFTFYNQRQLEFSVSSNGLVQLWPTLIGMPSNSFDNVAIPNAAGPNGFIAAFWDDLFPLAGAMGMPGSSVLTRTLGTAPNRRFVIQWTNFTIYDDQRARMTMQVKLFEGAQAIELHYCTLTPGMMTDRITGNSATVGIESPDGMAGRQHSFNRAMSVNTTTAYRFTP